MTRGQARGAVAGAPLRATSAPLGHTIVPIARSTRTRRKYSRSRSGSKIGPSPTRYDRSTSPRKPSLNVDPEFRAFLGAARERLTANVTAIAPAAECCRFGEWTWANGGSLQQSSVIGASVCNRMSDSPRMQCPGSPGGITIVGVLAPQVQDSRRGCPSRHLCLTSQRSSAECYGTPLGVYCTRADQQISHPRGLVRR